MQARIKCMDDEEEFAGTFVRDGESEDTEWSNLGAPAEIDIAQTPCQLPENPSAAHAM
jgi:hypothetical protein